MNERLRRYKALHDDEGCEAEDAQDQHDNDMASTPSDDSVDAFGNNRWLHHYDGQNFVWSVHSKSFFNNQYKDLHYYVDGLVQDMSTMSIMEGKRGTVIVPVKQHTIPPNVSNCA